MQLEPRDIREPWHQGNTLPEDLWDHADFDSIDQLLDRFLLPDPFPKVLPPRIDPERDQDTEYDHGALADQP